MLLGIVLHTALFFMPDAWSEAYSAEVYPAEVSGIYTLLFFAIHGFRMPVFFLLSGFFTALLWQKRGLRKLGEQRLMRIALPLAIGAFTVIPATTTVFIWAFDAMEEVEYSIAWWPFIWLSTWSHLWFLWFILWLCGGFMLAAKLGVRFSHPAIWWLAVPLTLLPQLLMHEPTFGPDTSDKLIPDPVVLAYYALFFVFGAFMYQRRIQASAWWTLALLPALTVVFFGGLDLLFESKEEWAKPLAAVLAQAAFAWLMCFGLMGLFRLVRPQGRALLGALPVGRILLALPVAPAADSRGVRADRRLAYQGPIVKFVLLNVAVTAVLLVVYQFGVRYTPVGTILNGRRTRRSQPCGGSEGRRDYAIQAGPAPLGGGRSHPGDRKPALRQGTTVVRPSQRGMRLWTCCTTSATLPKRALSVRLPTGQ